MPSLQESACNAGDLALIPGLGSANLCLILIENFSPRVLPWTRVLLMGAHPWRKLLMKVSLGGV